MISLEFFGCLVVVIGAVIAWGPAGTPPGGFERFPLLLKEFRDSQKAGQPPSDDALMAHRQLRCYQIGGFVVALGLTLVAVGTFAA